MSHPDKSRVVVVLASDQRANEMYVHARNFRAPLASPTLFPGLFHWRGDVGEKRPRNEVARVVGPPNFALTFAFFPPLLPCIYLYVVS